MREQPTETTAQGRRGHGVAVEADGDLSRMRALFPGLSRTMDGRPCVFADAPGGTQVPRTVIEAMVAYLERSNANLGGAYSTSQESDAVVAEARQAGADLVGCSPDEIVFGQNTTSLLFALSRSLARSLRPGDEVVVTRLDHDANIAPWLQAAADAGATIKWVDVRDGDCSLDPASLEAALGPRTRVVAFTLASNAVGTVTDAAQVMSLVRQTRAVAVADAVHLAPHDVIDIGELGADVLFCSAYKVFGPHVGMMVGRRELLEEWEPYRVRPSPDWPPDRWETGTQSHEALAGLAAAVEYLASMGRGGGQPPGDRRGAIEVAMGAVKAYEAGLSERFLRGLEELPQVALYGIGDPARAADRVPTFALRVRGLSPRKVAEELGRRGVFVWDGNYYAMTLMQRLGLEETGGAVRVGFCHYNTPAEVDRVLKELDRLASR